MSALLSAFQSSRISGLDAVLWFGRALDFPYEKQGSAYGGRTRISALRGPCPNRLDERANGLGMYRADK
jgi:hypothetical protein